MTVNQKVLAEMKAKLKVVLTKFVFYVDSRGFILDFKRTDEAYTRHTMSMALFVNPLKEEVRIVDSFEMRFASDEQAKVFAVRYNEINMK